MRILHGSSDITHIYAQEKVITIPSHSATRAFLFGNVSDYVLVIDDFERQMLLDERQGMAFPYHDGVLDISTAHFDSKAELQWILKNRDLTHVQKLSYMHSVLTLHHGTFDEEYEEQIMAMMFIRPEATVLEIGGNIGRNTCVVGSVLNDSSRLVVFECDPLTAEQLQENIAQNNLRCAVEACAISARPLRQYGWMTTTAEIDTWTAVSAVTWPEVLDKYKHLHFDTLIADCEGALQHIVEDEPDFFSHFQTVIVENDYVDELAKEAVDANLTRHGFECVYYKSLSNENNVWARFPAKVRERFYETWVRK